MTERKFKKKEPDVLKPNLIDKVIRLWSRVRFIPKIVGPDEMAIRVILGEPEDFCDSGLHWMPWLSNSSLKKYPKKVYNLDYRAREVISRKAEIYGAQVLKVDSVAYVTLPRFYTLTSVSYREKKGENAKSIRLQVNSERELGTDSLKKEISRQRQVQAREIRDVRIIGGLVQIMRSQVPTDEDPLKNFTEEAVVGALRVAMGKVTWREATEDIEAVRKNAENIFKSSDGTLIRAGFRPENLKLAIEEIKLPKELEDALPAPDKARLDAQAAEFVKKTRATETVGTIIQMMAQSRGLDPEEIQKSINKDSELRQEFLREAQDLIRRRMAIDGKSFVDIRVEGAEGIERTLLNLVATWRRIPEEGKEKEEKKGDREGPPQKRARLPNRGERRRRTEEWS